MSRAMDRLEKKLKADAWDDALDDLALIKSEISEWGRNASRMVADNAALGEENVRLKRAHGGMCGALATLLKRAVDENADQAGK